MSRTHRGTAEVTLTDEHDTEYSLTVRYSLSDGSNQYYDRNYGWQPAEGPELEISDVLCCSVKFHGALGEMGELYVPADQRKSLGSWCRETFDDEIDEKVREVASESAAEKYDPCDPRI